MSETPVQDLAVQQIGPVTIYFGDRNGRYPDCNTLVVDGESERVLIDPGLGYVKRFRSPEVILPNVNRVLLTHAHEDHLGGAFLHPGVSLHVHEDDLQGLQSLEGLLEIYGYHEAHVMELLQKSLFETFHYSPRPDAVAMRAGDIFLLGGGVSIQVAHTPGHTRGHCCFIVRWSEGVTEGASEPKTLIFLGDIDLSSFGPFYGDSWSDLVQFESTLELVREWEADWYVSAHHVGVLSTREAFCHRFERFASMIANRETRLLQYLSKPHTLVEMVDRKFVYRPGDDEKLYYVNSVEYRHLQLHVERLLRVQKIKELPGGKYQRLDTVE